MPAGPFAPFYRPGAERAMAVPQAPGVRTGPVPRQALDAAMTLELGALAPEAAMINAEGALDLQPLQHARPTLPELPNPDSAQRRAMIDALDAGMTAPTTSGSLIEGLTRGGEAYFRAKSARDDRDREAGDRSHAQMEEHRRRSAQIDALNAAQGEGDPEARNNAVIQALGGGDQEAALDMLNARTGRQLEMADAVDLQRQIGPMETEQRLAGQGYRDDGEGGYERFGPAADDWALAQQNVGLGYARLRDDNGRENRADARAEASMRTEFTRSQGDFIATRDHYATIRDLARRQGEALAGGGDASATTDMSMVFSFMKLLDPTSVVREGEYANAQNSAGVPDRVRNLYNRAANGSFLSTGQRQQFLNDAEGIYATRLAQHERDRTLYRDMAETYQYDPERVAPNYSLPELAAATEPDDGAMTAMPPARENRGRTIFDEDGNRFTSDGVRWTPVGVGGSSYGQRAPPARRTAFDGPRGPGRHAVPGGD